jgi:hypothetical protein
MPFGIAAATYFNGSDKSGPGFGRNLRWIGQTAQTKLVATAAPSRHDHSQTVSKRRATGHSNLHHRAYRPRTSEITAPTSASAASRVALFAEPPVK